jgi:hypothetical protein
MRLLTFRRLAVVGAAGALSAAAVFGFVARGDAAGTNVCPGSACLATVVSPHVTSTTAISNLGSGDFAAFAAGRFTNNASTATHLNLTLTFRSGSDSATVKIDTSKIGTLIDGSAVTATCDPLQTSSSHVIPVSRVSCDFPNLQGGHYAKLQVPFTPVTPTTAGSTITADLTASYGEGNGGANDSQGPVGDSLTIGDGTKATGKCTTGASSLPSVANSNATVAIGVPSYPAASGDQNLPCTGVGIQALDDKVTINNIAGYVVALELPKVGTFAEVVHDVTPLPEKTTLKSLTIWESLQSSGGANTFTLKVGPCNAQGLPSPTDSSFSSDTCVFDRLPLPKGGGRFVLHSTGNKLDPRYTP